MKRHLAIVSAGIMLAAFSAAPALAQAKGEPPTAEQRESRYQIGVMERVLEGAVEHGVTTIRDQLQTLGPTELLIEDNAKARGFRLDGYGVFFDVAVPSFDTTVLWTTRTLDQNDLGLASAMKALQTHVEQTGDPSLEQALRRVQIQLAPGVPANATADSVFVPPAGARASTGGPANAADNNNSVSERPAAAPAAAPARNIDAILADTDEAYRKQVVSALMEAMLDHSSALGIGPNEWLTVAARRSEQRPRLAPADTDSRTILIRLKGSDLSAFLARQISKDEALQRFEVRVF